MSSAPIAAATVTAVAQTPTSSRTSGHALARAVPDRGDHFRSNKPPTPSLADLKVTLSHAPESRTSRRRPTSVPVQPQALSPRVRRAVQLSKIRRSDDEAAGTGGVGVPSASTTVDAGGSSSVNCMLEKLHKVRRRRSASHVRRLPSASAEAKLQQFAWTPTEVQAQHATRTAESKLRSGSNAPAVHSAVLFGPRLPHSTNGGDGGRGADGDFGSESPSTFSASPSSAVLYSTFQLRVTALEFEGAASVPGDSSASEGALRLAHSFVCSFQCQNCGFDTPQSLPAPTGEAHTHGPTRRCHVWSDHEHCLVLRVPESRRTTFRRRRRRKVRRPLILDSDDGCDGEDSECSLNAQAVRARVTRERNGTNDDDDERDGGDNDGGCGNDDDDDDTWGSPSPVSSVRLASSAETAGSSRWAAAAIPVSICVHVVSAGGSSASSGPGGRGGGGDGGGGGRSTYVMTRNVGKAEVTLATFCNGSTDCRGEWVKAAWYQVYGTDGAALGRVRLVSKVCFPALSLPLAMQVRAQFVSEFADAALLPADAEAAGLYHFCFAAEQPRVKLAREPNALVPGKDCATMRGGATARDSTGSASGRNSVAGWSEAAPRTPLRARTPSTRSPTANAASASSPTTAAAAAAAAARRAAGPNTPGNAGLRRRLGTQLQSQHLRPAGSAGTVGQAGSNEPVGRWGPLRDSCDLITQTSGDGERRFILVYRWWARVRGRAAKLLRTSVPRDMRCTTAAEPPGVALARGSEGGGEAAGGGGGGVVLSAYAPWCVCIVYRVKTHSRMRQLLCKRMATVKHDLTLEQHGRAGGQQAPGGVHFRKFADFGTERRLLSLKKKAPAVSLRNYFDEAIRGAEDSGGRSSLQLQDIPLLRARPPKGLLLPANDVDYDALLRHCQPLALVVAWRALISQKRVVLTHPDQGLLAVMAEALVSLAWPLEWSGTYLPTMPLQPHFLRLLESPFPYVFGLPVSTTAAAARADRVVQDLLLQRQALLEEAEGDLVWVDLEQGEFFPATEPLPPPHIFRDLFCFVADAAGRRSAGRAGAVATGSAARPKVPTGHVRSECEHLRWRFVHGLAKIVFGYNHHLEHLKMGRVRSFLAGKLGPPQSPAAVAGAEGPAAAPASGFSNPAAAAATGSRTSGGQHGEDIDDDAPIPAFDEANSFHRLLRAVAESQDFQMFALKKAGLYAEAEGKEAKVPDSEWEAFDWLCAYELRRARQHHPMR